MKLKNSHIAHDMVIILAFLLGIIEGQLSSWNFKYHARLDDKTKSINEVEKVQLWWNFDQTYIWFRLKVLSLGYISFGFSKNGEIANSDMIRAWIAPNKTIYFWDCFAVTDKLIATDPSQDYDYYGVESDNYTILDFKRKLDTCDSMDLELTGDSMFVHWAYHASDPESRNAFLNFGMVRGTAPILLFNHRILDFNSENDTLNSKSLQLNIKVTDFRSTYMCKLFQMPTFSKKRHVIKRNLILPPELSHSVKHIVLHACSNAIDMSPYIKYVKNCYQQGFPPELFYCNNIITGWTIGSDHEFYWPSEAGYSMGDYGDPKFVMLEILFDQMPPTNDIHLIQKDVSVGVELIYTDRVRKYDSGVLSTGPEPSDWFFVPPGQENFVVEGHCVGKCSASDFPPQGITLYASQFYTHGNVKMAEALQIRNGREYARVARDENIITNFQNTRYINEPLILKPGDSLITRCLYDTSSETNVITSGVFWYQKPCMQFIFYYPKVARLTTCRSEVIPAQIYSLFAGMHRKESNVDFKYGSIYDAEIVGLDNKTVTLYDHINMLPWDKNKKALNHLRSIYEHGDFLNLCRDIDRSPLLNTETLNPYPTIFQKLPSLRTSMCVQKEPISSITSTTTNPETFKASNTNLKYNTISTNVSNIYEKNKTNFVKLSYSPKIVIASHTTHPYFNTDVTKSKDLLQSSGNKQDYEQNLKEDHHTLMSTELADRSVDQHYTTPKNIGKFRTLINSTKFSSVYNELERFVDSNTLNYSQNLTRIVESVKEADIRVKYGIITNNIKSIGIEDLVIRKDDIFMVQVVRENGGSDINPYFEKVNNTRAAQNLIDNIPNFISANNADRLKPADSEISSAFTSYIKVKSPKSYLTCLTLLAILQKLYL